MSADDYAAVLAGVDAPQPLPERLREHFEQALIGPEEGLLVFRGLDAARRLPSELYASLEVQLRRRHRKTLAAAERRGRRDRLRTLLRRVLIFRRDRRPPSSS